MKHISILILVIVSTLNTTAQVSPKDKIQNKSNAEIFSNTAGTLIQKEFETIGLVKKCNIQVVTFSDLISGQKSMAIRFEYTTSSGYSSSSEIALLDADEVDGLIKSINLIKEKIIPTTATNYTEVSFKSRSGFEAGCFSDKSKKWSTYFMLDRNNDRSFIPLDLEGLDNFLGFIEQAKSKLK